MFDLRSFLRRAPKPRKLRIRTSDGDERIIDLGDGRVKWATVEETVRGAQAVHVECLDKADHILRGERLSEDEAEAASDEDAKVKAEDRKAQSLMTAQAAVLDRYGARINEAFDKGVKASSASQEVLQALVTELCDHFALAITNLHQVSVNFANLMTQRVVDENGGDARDGALQQIIAAMGGKILGGGGGNGMATPPVKESK